MRELSGGEAHRLFSQLGMVEQIKRDKLDRIIEVRRNNDYLLVAGLHIKASIDQRQL
jgi:hypothetical protein